MVIKGINTMDETYYIDADTSVKVTAYQITATSVMLIRDLVTKNDVLRANGKVFERTDIPDCVEKTSLKRIAEFLLETEGIKEVRYHQEEREIIVSAG